MDRRVCDRSAFVPGEQALQPPRPDPYQQPPQPPASQHPASHQAAPYPAAPYPAAPYPPASQPPAAYPDAPHQQLPPYPPAPVPRHDPVVGAQPFTIVNVTHVERPGRTLPPIVAHHLSDYGTVHLIHLILTLVSAGTWLPAWIIHTIVLIARDKTSAATGLAIPAHPRRPVALPGDRNQQALAMLARHKARRAEARKLADADPLSAKQLDIGRRDIPNRQYDDGGLVDINRVPAEVFTYFSGITPEQAAHIVAVRERLGGAFSSVAELMALAELPPDLEPEVMEYAIAIR